MPQTERSQSLLVAAAWLIVILTTAWGLSYTVKNALKLFTAPSAASAAPSTR